MQIVKGRAAERVCHFNDLSLDEPAKTVAHRNQGLAGSSRSHPSPKTARLDPHPCGQDRISGGVNRVAVIAAQIAMLDKWYTAAYGSQCSYRKLFSVKQHAKWV
ncbi:hypothetical protein SL1157_1348 [Ruegeria lacuscaerulensis ITI-1157]|nr:hypothetical protein SL1157_1348 [Ruegeria lacuscaerulensis ITI-1157]